MIFLKLAQNIDCGYMLRVVSTHNLCIGAKIRKRGLPLHTTVWLYKSGVQGGITRTCFPDVKCISDFMTFELGLSACLRECITDLY